MSNRIPPHTCPTCNKTLDGSSSLGDSSDVPSPGDLSICKYCGELSVFKDDLSQRPITQEETNTLDPGQAAYIRSIQQLLRSHGGLKS